MNESLNARLWFVVGSTTAPNLASIVGNSLRGGNEPELRLPKSAENHGWNKP
jgi:hypothetical protein